MPIGAVRTQQVVTCTRDMSVLEMAKLMRSKHVGDVVVIEDRGSDLKPVGIVTDRDLVIEVMAAEVDPTFITAGDVMSSDLVVAYEGEELDVVVERMHLACVRRVPLIDSSGALVGIVTLDDIVALHASTLGDVSRIGRMQYGEEQRLRP